jgi:TolB-like protein/rhodanese-related sulfurtransferase/Tfp pilus assembly protein PilF
MGDGTLMEFGSVVDAVHFAVEVQIAMQARNAEVPEDRQIIYRIGINIGDIIVEGDDIYGDGVNVAARLEGLAEPGGICAARTVINHVKGKVELDFEDLGDQEVKNIAEPVRVYRVVLDDRAAALVTPLVETPPRVDPLRRRQIASAVGVGLIVIGGLIWWQPWGPEFEPASVEKMALPLPEKPSIAVLPFDNMSGDAEQDYFADGMTDDLITDLSKISDLFVIARNSTFTYKGKPVKVQQVAEDLGVRYVLEGSVRRVGDEVRINAQLIDALSGHHVWAERYDGSLADVFAIQDNVIEKIVSALALNLTTPASAETVAVSEEPASLEEQSAAVSETPLQLTAETDTLQAYDAFLEGWEHYRRQTAEDAGKAIPAFEKAIEIDPGYGRAYAGLAAVYWDIANLVWYDILGMEWQHALNWAQENLAKALEDPTSKAHAVSAEMLAMQGRNDDALEAIERAIALDSNDPDNYVSKARILSILGRAVEAEENVRLAMRLNPFHRQELRALGRSLLHQERYEEAAETMERVVGKEWVNVYDYQTLASIYGHLGRLEDAAAAVRKYNEIYGEWKYTPMTVQEAGYWWYGDMFDYDKAYIARLQEGLRKAGVPEGTAPRTDDFDFMGLMRKSAGIYAVEGATRIDAATAKAMHERGAVFIDVRDAGSYARGHIPGAVHLDLNVALTEESLSRAVGKGDEVVFQCWGEECPYSAYAAAKAIIWGFTRVYRFADGYPGWTDAGYPVETYEGF